MTTTVAIAKIDLGDVGEWIASLGAVLASAVAIGIAFWSHRNEKRSAAIVAYRISSTRTVEISTRRDVFW